jgi:glycosyltransferase involved in cell wall biosynthesis
MTENDKSVSVIIPCGGEHARYVGDAVASCMKGLVCPYEVIVVDDAANAPVDQALDLMSHAVAPPHVRVYQLDHHMGRSAARNYAVGRSAGAWLFFLDADDILEPTAMADFLRICDVPPVADIVYADYDYLDDAGQKRRVEKPRWVRSGHRLPPDVSNPVNIGMFVKKDRFLAVGGFDEDMAFMEYWDFFLRYTANPSAQVLKARRPFFTARCHSVAGDRAQTMAWLGSRKIQAMIRGGYYTQWAHR